MTYPVQGGSALPVYVTNGATETTMAQILASLISTLTVEQFSYTTVATGEVQGSATAAQFPDVACALAKIKARNDNAGNVYLGISGVTKPDGTTDATTGFELDAGEETGWLPIDNLNRLYRICDNAGDDVVYLVLR